jgi:hypothetical protein
MEMVIAYYSQFWTIRNRKGFIGGDCKVSLVVIAAEDSLARFYAEPGWKNARGVGS